MPSITINQTQIYYEDSAPNDAKKPVLLFAHGLTWSGRLYDKQVAYLKDNYRCITYDFRGQGQSAISRHGYDMDTLTEDTLSLIKYLNITQCHFIGLSMGGFVGMRLAIRHPNVLLSLTLLDTSADAEPTKNIADYSKLLKTIKWLGLKNVSKKIMPIMFGQTFLADKSRKAEYKACKKLIDQNNKKGLIKATKGVIYRQAIYDQLHNITVPTLIGVGSEDVATRYEKSERMHFAIKGSKLVVFANSGHTSTIEEPKQVNTALEKFLSSIVS